MTDARPQDIDINALTLPELDDLIARTEEDLASMQAKIDSVKATRIQTGEYADADWFARIKAAKRFSGQRHQAMLRRAAQLRQAARAGQAQTFEQAFVAEAKSVLSAETFGDIVAAARAATR